MTISTETKEKRAQLILQARILAQVQGERERQDEKWGEQMHRPSFWMTILMEEVGEVAHEALLVEAEGSALPVPLHFQNMKTELIQVAAVAVGMLESMEQHPEWEDRNFPTDEP